MNYHAPFFGLEPESKKENAQELERMERCAKAAGLSVPVYQGQTRDLNMALDWFCPDCLNKLQVGWVFIRNGCAISAELMRPKEGERHAVLFCPSFAGSCDYSFSNKAVRQQTGAFWLDGFKYPLNPVTLVQAKIRKVGKSIACSERTIKEHESNIVERKKELAALEQELINVKASLIG